MTYLADFGNVWGADHSVTFQKSETALASFCRSTLSGYFSNDRLNLI